MRTIQSLRVQTPNVLARMIHIGDVIIKTFNSEMRLTDVNNPRQNGEDDRCLFTQSTE